MSNHYYNALTGEPCYTVLTKDGKPRNTNVADARKLGLVPSYSTIVSLLNKEGINLWMQDQLLEACIEWPYNNTEEWKKEVKDIAGRLGRKGRERGTMVHDALEKSYKGEGLSLELHDLICPVLDLVEDTFHIPTNKWVAEESFAFNGYGGKVDLHTRDFGEKYFAVIDGDGREIDWADTQEKATEKADNFETIQVRRTGVIIDFKTKDVEDIKKMKPYPQDVMQHAAYRDGLDIPRAKCYTLFVNVRHPGMLTLHEWKEEEVTRAGKMFNTLKDFWYLNAGMELPNG